MKSRLIRTLVSQKCLSVQLVLGPIDQTLVNITESTSEKCHSIILRDTTGAEEFDSMRKLLYEGADAFLVAFEAESGIDSSADVLFRIAEERWLPELMLHDPNASLIFVAVHTTRPDRHQEMGGTRILRSRVAYKPGAVLPRFLALVCSLDHVDSVTTVFAKVSSSNPPFNVIFLFARVTAVLDSNVQTSGF